MRVTQALLRVCLRWLLAFGALIAACPSTDAATRETVPAEFVHAQVWVTPTHHGRTLRLFTDTGGGWNAISGSVATWLALPSARIDGHHVASWPGFEPDAIPPPPRHFLDGKLVVADPAELFGADGFLGGRWFADGVWEFDYPKARLRRLRDFRPEPNHPHRVELGFQTDASGRRTMHFPSIEVTIDGETLPMLYDSGATATLTESSAPQFDLAAGTNIGTSFIEREVFERWATTHPDWKIIESADRKGSQLRRMVQVPTVFVAGHVVGPVWFSEQPSGAFQKYMAQMMDRPTWGALGGSALKYFRVVLDYPDGAAYFHRDTKDIPR